jgi:hypothetical protein
MAFAIVLAATALWMTAYPCRSVPTTDGAPGLDANGW